MRIVEIIIENGPQGDSMLRRQGFNAGSLGKWLPELVEEQILRRRETDEKGWPLGPGKAQLYHLTVKGVKSFFPSWDKIDALAKERLVHLSNYRDLGIVPGSAHASEAESSPVTINKTSRNVQAETYIESQVREEPRPKLPVGMGLAMANMPDLFPNYKPRTAQEEYAQQFAQGQIAEATCKMCGHPNSPEFVSLKICKKCGAPL